MVTKGSVTQVQNRNEVREWLDEMGIVLTLSNDNLPQIRQQLVEFGINEATEGKPYANRGKTAA